MNCEFAFKTIVLVLFTAVSTTLFSCPTFAQEDEFEFNWNPGGNSLQWMDPTNWNAGDADGPTPGGSEAVVNIGAGSPAFLNNGGGGGILLLNIGQNARLDIESGFLSFGSRTAARPFSIQNSGELNITGNTAELRLRDTVANFSPAVIKLENGGSLNLVDGDTTLNTSNEDTGNGTVMLRSDTGEPESKITGTAGTRFFIEKQTLSGHGNIGDNKLGLTFDADTIVDANVSGQTLTVDGDNTIGVVNQGMMRASGGGNLRLGSGPIDNTNGEIEALAGSSVELASGFNLFGGTLRDVGSGSSSISGSGTLADITLEGTNLVFDGGSDLSLNGVINNQGDIKSLNPGNANTDLVIDGATRLEGGGTITLEGPSSGQSRVIDYVGADGVLTNVDNTIQGTGSVGTGTVQIINEADGTIDANAAGQSLTLSPVAGSAMVNRGRMVASDGGALVFGSGQYDNANGLIDVQAGSTISLGAGATISGGTFRDSGTVRSLSSATLKDLTLEGDLEIALGDDLRLDGTINNLGDIKALNPGNANSDLVIDGATRLEGGGTMTLAGPNTSQSRVIDYSGSDGVLTNFDNTIQGLGSLGSNSVQIINEAGGMITGNDDGGTLSVGVSAANSSVNRGLITSSDGGTLKFTSGDFDNINGLVEAGDEGTVTVGGTATVSGGLFNAADGGTIKITDSGSIINALLQSSGTGNYQTDIGTGALVDSTNQSSITVSGGAGLRLSGVINNQGDIKSLNPGNANTDLVIDGATRLEGGGTITLEGSSSGQSRVVDYSGADGVLTNVDNTIQGTGTLGTNTVQIVNESGGTVDANATGQSLTLNSVAGSPMINRGRLTASSGGTLALGGGEYDNASGLIDVQDAATISLGSNATITGGLFRSQGTGVIRSISSAKLKDLTLEGNLEIALGDDVQLDGTIDNLGDLTMRNPGNANTDLVIDGATRLEGGGTITLAGPSSIQSRVVDYTGADGVLTNVDNTIQGTGSVGTSSVQVINEAGGTIDANVTGQSLRLNPVAGTAMVNRGRLIASNGGTLVFGAGQFNNTDGLIDLQDGSAITLGANSTITGGTFRDMGTVRSSSSATLKDLTLEGNLEIALGDAVRFDGTINNLGDVMLSNPGNANTDLVIDGGTRLEGGGTITLGGPNSTQSRIVDYTGADGVLTNVDNTIQGAGTVGNNFVQIVNQSGGTIHANQTDRVLAVDSSGATIANAGQLMASNGGILTFVDATINNTGTLNAQADSEIRFNDIINGVGGRFVGDGALVGNSIVNEGILAPGYSPGTLSIESDLILGSTSDLQIELASLLDFDFLSIDGATTLGGDLSLYLLDGYTPDQADVFDVLSSTSLTSSFINVSDGSLLQTSDGRGSFIVNYSGNNVTLSNFSATSVPEPSAATLVLIGGFIGLSRRRRSC